MTTEPVIAVNDWGYRKKLAADLDGAMENLRVATQLLEAVQYVTDHHARLSMARDARHRIQQARGVCVRVRSKLDPERDP